MQEKIKTLDKVFDFKEKIFDKNNPKVLTDMLEEARKNKLYYFSGREICNNKNNFKPITYLKLLDYQNYPDELKHYLEKIKQFYEGTN